jgi:1A family penicillin-binding protein
MDDAPPPAPPPAADRLAAIRDRLARERARARVVADRLWRDHRPIVVGAAALLVLGLTTAGLLWGQCGWAGCPNVDRLRAYQPGKASRLLDRQGRPFAELRPVEGATIPLGRIPRHVRDAFLAVEDQRFYTHGGVDWRRVAGAALANLRRGGVAQGFSTVTMQLARNVFPDRIPARERTLGRKLLEVRVAYEIEHRFDKDEILELYLSHIYFGNGARGVEAAARHYFGTSAARLTLNQAALLAALIRGPSHYDPRRYPDRARERRDLVLTLMERQGLIEEPAAAAARAMPLGVARRRTAGTSADAGLAPYFAEEVRRQLEDRLGERVYDETLSVTTTLDAGLQRAAEEELARQLRAVESGALGRFSGPRYSAGGPSESGTPYLQGAVVALGVGTGDVLAWVGGRDFQQSRFDRVKSSRRQVGSAFKPFVYAAALGKGHYLSERLSDEPIQVRLDRNRVWEPQNFDQEYGGEVTMRDALVRSKNIPTVRLASAVGLAEVAKAAHEAGILTAIDETPAMPLGTVAVSPLELTTAYAAFAGLGEVAAPRLVLRVAAEDGSEVWSADPPRVERVMDPGIAFLVTNVLQEAVERGTGTAVRASHFEGAVAGKTGTTNDGTDTWFVGYTPRVVAAVWMGFDEPRPIMAQATGGRLAAPVWGRTFARVAGFGGDEPWPAPASVVQASIDPETGLPLAAGCQSYWGEDHRELFLRRAVPAAVCPDGREATVADDDGRRSDDEEHTAGSEPWPEDMRGGSDPAPPPEYEEAETWRRARREAEKAWREARKEYDRQLKEWRKEQRRRRRDQPDER